MSKHRNNASLNELKYLFKDLDPLAAIKLLAENPNYLAKNKEPINFFYFIELPTIIHAYSSGSIAESNKIVSSVVEGEKYFKQSIKQQLSLIEKNKLLMNLAEKLHESTFALRIGHSPIREQEMDEESLKNAMMLEKKIGIKAKTEELYKDPYIKTFIVLEDLFNSKLEVQKNKRRQEIERLNKKYGIIEKKGNLFAPNIQNIIKKKIKAGQSIEGIRRSFISDMEKIRTLRFNGIISHILGLYILPEEIFLENVEKFDLDSGIVKDVINLVSRTKEESQRYIENFLSLLFYKTEKPIMKVGKHLIYVKKDYPLGYKTTDFILDFWEHADKKEAYVQVGLSFEESVVKWLKERGKNVLRVTYPRDKKFQPIPLNDLTLPYLSSIAKRRGRNLPLTSKDIDLMVWDKKELRVYEIKGWRVPLECLSNTNILCSRLATEMRWIDEINIVRRLVDEKREFIQKLLKREFNEDVPLDGIEKIKSGLITLYFSPCMIKELRYVFYACEKDLGRLNVNEQGFIMERPEKINNFFRLFEERIREENIAKQVEVGGELAKHDPLLVEREKTELKPFYKMIPGIKIDKMAKIYDEFIDSLEEGYRTAWESYKTILKKLE